MGLKAAIEWVRERIYPAKVAPFVEMIADAIVAAPGDFDVEREGALLKVKIRDNPSPMIDNMLVTNGVGIEVDALANTIIVTTFYFDDVQLNWREQRLLMDAVAVLLEAYEDAAVMVIDSDFQVLQ